MKASFGNFVFSFIVAVSMNAGQSAETTVAIPPKFSVTTAALFPDKVLARGKGVEVKQSQVDDMFLSFKSHRAALGVRVPDAARPKIEKEILDKLVTTQLLLALATDADRANATKLAADFVSEQKKQLPSEESFHRQLLAVGMTPEQFQAQVLEQAVIKNVIDRELKRNKTVTDQRLKEFYGNNPSLFSDPDLVRVSHILIATHDPATGKPLAEEQKREKWALAEKVLKQARSGEDFAKLVAAFSEDAVSKDKGGEYRIARTDRDRPAPEFDAAAFSLALDQISDIVTTRYGYHIIKLLEKTPSRLIEFDKVKEQIRESLLQQDIQRELPTYVEKLKKEAEVEILNTATR